MEYRKFPQGYVMRLDPGEEIVEQLTALVERENVRLGSVSALGAAGDVTIGIFNTREKQYHSRRYQGDYEISALVGNVSRKEGEPYLHLHLPPGEVRGGRRPRWGRRRPGRQRGGGGRRPHVHPHGLPL